MGRWERVASLAAGWTPGVSKGRPQRWAAVGKLVMLDFDGVVADSLDGWCAATVSALNDRGFPHLASREWVLELVEDNWFAGLVKAGVPRSVIENIDDRFAAIAAAGAIRPYPEMPAVVAHLAERHEVVIITSNRTDIVERLLAAWGISHVGEVLGGDKEPSKVRKIRSAASGNESTSAVFVGDTVGDILEAKEAGVGAIAVTWGWHSEEQLAAVSPDCIARKPRDLLLLLS